MIHRRKQHIVLFVLALYSVSTLLFLPLHRDHIEAGSAGAPVFAVHSDADHCKHIDPHHDADCVLCSSSANRFALAPSAFIMVQQPSVYILVNTVPFTLRSSLQPESISRRGPPPVHV